MRYPQGLQSTVNIVDLALVGPVTAPVLRGDIDVLRASYRLPFDSRLGYLGFFGGDDGQSLGAGAVDVDVRPASPLTLNVRIRAPSMPFIDNRAANAYIVGSADMNVTGTIDQPVITGRIEIDRGQMMFNGNRYNLLPGSIDFSNPATFEPFFDVTAESDLRPGGERYHVTIRLTGTFDQFGAALWSEPWLSQTQIIALIMGEAPDVGAVELRNLSSPQDEQARAIASLGTQFILSPITAQVGSAIQKATTLNAALVPMLGTESTLQQLNPTARIVLGRRVSSRVYVTYSRNVSGTQNEIILVEYEQNDKVSWVLSRNEDKTFALDFRIRYVIR
jgi:autotransporter translocation and assembly factor TamB